MMGTCRSQENPNQGIQGLWETQQLDIVEQGSDGRRGFDRKSPKHYYSQVVTETHQGSRVFDMYSSILSPGQSLPVAVYDNVSSRTNHSAPAAQGQPMKQQDEVHYSVIHVSHSEKQEVPHQLVGSHVQSNQQEQVLYSAINFQGPKAAPE